MSRIILAIGRIPTNRYNGGLLRALSTARILCSLSDRIKVIFVTTYPSDSLKNDINGFSVYAPINKEIIKNKENKFLYQLSEKIYPFYNMKIIKYCFNWIKSHFNPNDINILMGLDGSFNSQPAIWLKEIWNKPLLIDDIPDSLHMLRHPYHKLIIKKAFKIADFIFVMSRGALDYLVKVYKLSPKKILIIPTIIDDNVFVYKESGEYKHYQDEIRQNLNLYGPVVLNIGRLPQFSMRKKFIEIFKFVVKEIPEVKFLFVGEPFTDLVKKIKDKMYVKNIIHVSYQNHFDIPKYISIADVCPLFYPSNFLGTPHRTFEYMFMRKPTVTMNFPGIKDLLDNSCAEIILSENSALFARGIIKLIKDKKYSEELCEKAYKKIINYTNKERIINIIKSSALSDLI